MSIKLISASPKATSGPMADYDDHSNSKAGKFTAAPDLAAASGRLTFGWADDG